ncbi:MAG: TonB-dependent receptor [Janthinobacterium lividum]
MKFSTPRLHPLGAAVLAACCCTAHAQQESDSSVKTLGTITVTTGQPTSLPTQIPTTIETTTAEQIQDTVNATDSEDALKYFPSLLVRKRYIGDYDHAVLASRASGTGNSARSMVYADGILLSNLLGNGASYTPRWGMVTPEEIDRVDVLYGPFSAAYPGNSVGAVVDYVTRLPTRFEGHAKVSAFTSNYDLYNTHQSYSGHQESASLGNRQGAWSWWVDASRLDSDGQPLVIVSKTPCGAGNACPAGTPTAVTGAVASRDIRNQTVQLMGTSSQTRTVQDQGKVKLAYDFSPTVRASYLLGWWNNEARRSADSYLRDAAGAPVYSGVVSIGGASYALLPSDFAPSRASQEHLMQALTVKSNTRGTWDWEAAASVYDYRKDQVRTATTALANTTGGSAGELADLHGTGWNTLALKGTWRPDGISGAHVADFGYQHEAYQLRTVVSSTPDWASGAAGARVSAFSGNTQLQSLYAQDTWRFAPLWKTTLGARLEQWQASDGSRSSAVATAGYPERRETNLSPKGALAYQLTPQWALKASLGRAVRMPTVAELFQGTLNAGDIVNNNPNLKPEKSWTSELSAERELGNGVLRTTLFHEDTRDALYSQAQLTATGTTTTVQNVDHMRTTGVELAYQAVNVATRGLDLSGSITFADSKTVSNANNPASEGKWQPRVPRWRASALATYRPDERWTYSVGTRFSGRQYGQLDNSDVNANAYTGVSSFLVTDVRLRYRLSKQLMASLGVDNVSNRTYWNFHPYPQRTAVLELKFDLD